MIKTPFILQEEEAPEEEAPEEETPEGPEKKEEEV